MPFNYFTTFWKGLSRPISHIICTGVSGFNVVVVGTTAHSTPSGRGIPTLSLPNVASARSPIPCRTLCRSDVARRAIPRLMSLRVKQDFALPSVAAALWLRRIALLIRMCNPFRRPTAASRRANGDAVTYHPMQPHRTRIGIESMLTSQKRYSLWMYRLPDMQLLQHLSCNCHRIGSRSVFKSIGSFFTHLILLRDERLKRRFPLCWNGNLLINCIPSYRMTVR